MKIYEHKRIGHRIILKIFNIKFSFHFPPKKNQYIPLGTNCFVRMLLTNFRLKSTKKQGELSFPFDLCTTPIHSLVKILENDFSDFFEDLVQSEKGKWEQFMNKKYSIYYPHDENLTLDDFKVRYMRRINNFRTILQESNLKIFILCCEQSSFSVDDLNRIYNYLSKTRSGKPFKFYVINFIYNNHPKADITNMNPQILFHEFDITKEYKIGWLGNFECLKDIINPDILNIF